jgi:hypothetical protein
MTSQLTREVSCKWIDELDCDAENNGLDRTKCLYWKSDEYNCVTDSANFMFDKHNHFAYCTSPGFDHKDFIKEYCLSSEYPEYESRQ